MKKPYLVHLVWAFVAIATFALGSKFTSSSDSPEDAATLSGNAPAISSRSVGENGADSPGNSRVRSKSARSGGSISAEPEFLSEAGVRQLGFDLKSAKGPLERREVFSQILKNLTAENAKLMREQILHLDHDSSEFREFHYAWGAIAGEEAVLHGGETRERDMASTLAGWAAKSPEAALAYFKGLDEKMQKGSDLKWGAIHGLTDADPNLAVRFAMDQQEAGDGEARRLMDVVTRQVLRSGDPAEAAQWATTLPAGEMQDAAISRVAREYADENPVASLDWASTLPSGDGKNKALWNSYNKWAGDNPAAAAERLGTMSASPERDSAAYGYASRVAWDNPEVGIEWASTISNKDTRNRAIIETGRVYFRKDPEAAKQWLSNSGLNAEQQKSITSRSGRRG